MQRPCYSTFELCYCPILLFLICVISDVARAASLEGDKKGLARGSRGQKGCGQDEGSQKVCGA